MHFEQTCKASGLVNDPSCAGGDDPMETLTIVLNDPPYGTEKVYNALRYAAGSWRRV